MSEGNTRRDFLLQSAALAGAGYFVAGASPQFAHSKSPNEKLNIAAVGVGGKGGSDIAHCATENIVALCDVDAKRLAEALKKYPGARGYADYREMFDKEAANIDAAIVSTPDHHHALASMLALKAGKHLYCQKPLTQTVYEARLVRDAAKQAGVVTQMGNQGTSLDSLRTGVEIVQSGVLGEVREVHVWSNRPVWPQGWSAILGHQGVRQALGKGKAAKLPETLNWDLWIGPADMRPYDPNYAHFKWRGWWDFGTGALGDMACHTMNLPFWSLGLEYPTSIEAEVPYINDQTPAEWSRIVFEFPERVFKKTGAKLPPVTLTWYDGTKTGLPMEKRTFNDKLAKLGVDKPDASGSLFIGSKGALYAPGDYAGSIELLPKADFATFKAPPQFLPRLPKTEKDFDYNHHQEWISAIKGQGQTMSNFEYAAYFTEIILLGNIAMRTGRKIEWDGPNMKATNAPEAQKFVKREYREGWKL